MLLLKSLIMYFKENTIISGHRDANPVDVAYCHVSGELRVLEIVGLC